VKKTVFLILLPLLTSALLQAQWYVSYEKGREAVKKGQWQQAVSQLTEAIDEASNSKAKKKMYGLQFIDYFPYLYRGVAYYRLGDLANARTDLEKARSEGVIEDAREDGEAPTLLAEYLGLIQKPAPQIAQQKPPQNPPQNVSPGPPKSELKKTEQMKTPDQKKSETAASEQKQKRERASGLFAAGVEFFKRDDLNKAEEQFKNVLELEPLNAGARNYLKRIDTRRQKLAASAAVHPKEVPGPALHEPVVTERAPAPDTAGSALFTDGVALFNGGKIGQAKARFHSLQTIAPSYPGLANYTGLISSVEERVHQGIAAFFEGEYREAIDKLSDQSKNGNDNPHVYAFLACSYAAEYLLAGGENGNLKKEAVDAFGKVKGINPRYELDKKLISPGIIALLTGE
jgi:tetratricopeptide (TPR) repeat protein